MNENAANYDGSGGQNYYPSISDPSMMGPADSYYGAGAPQPPYMSPGTGGAYYDNAGYQYVSPAVVEGYHHDSSPYGEWNPEYHDQQQLGVPEMTAPPGSFYPRASQLSPELYGSPVSAVTYNDVSAAIHVASHTQSLGNPRVRRSTGSSSRASLLVTHSATDGMLYSSCAGHPEAEKDVLSTIMKRVYNYSPSTSNPRTLQRKPAPHSYRPPYCGGDSHEPLTPFGGSTTISSSTQMGIRTLLPFDGYVASVSPAAVRVHNTGGLLVSDQEVQGMICGTPHPGGTNTMAHMTVGGTAWGFYKTQQVHCMDLYRDLRIVSSHGFKSDKSDPVVVTALATNHQRQSIVAGCTDGTIRLFDGSWRKRGGIDLAKVKSHTGGVVSVSVSEDGNLICTAGYSSRPSAGTATPYAFPDHFVMIYDSRYLGRGGVVHPFSGLQGGPRHVSFLPENGNSGSSGNRNRVLVCSGQSGGGLQVMTPFETENNMAENFFAPQLDVGEFVTAMCVSGREMALGTSQSKLIQYRMAAQEGTTHAFDSMGNEFVPSGAGGNAYTGDVAGGMSTSDSHQKVPLVSPAYAPKTPSLSIDPTLLIKASGPNKSIFSSYILHANPQVTPLGSSDVNNPSSFGILTAKPMLTAPKRNIAARVLDGCSKAEGDYLATVPTAELELDLFSEEKSEKPSKVENLPNPNRMLYSKTVSKICYDVDVDKSKWGERQKSAWNEGTSVLDTDEDGQLMIPPRYRCTLRPTQIGAAYFDHAQHNDTGVWPGWEYPHTMPNAFAPSVLLLLYFVPEIRSAVLAAQRDRRLYSNSSGKGPSLSPELGFLYHQIESLSRNAMTHPQEGNRARVGAFVPYNFLATFAAMPEAAALALLDGAPAAVETARRPEAFYRFLLHHLDRDLSGNDSSAPKLIDSLYGFGFTSVNEFITGSGPPTVSSTRALTVELAYEPFISTKENSPKKPCFGEVLRYSLCKESRLRAWCESTRSYETVVQRKIATSLPKILALSCCCSGKRGAEDGLSVWRTSAGDYGYFLPEFIEVELEDDGNVVVRELQEEGDPGTKSWKSYNGDGSLPLAVSAVLKSDKSLARMVRYRLDSVLSFIRDDCHDEEQQREGHHVLHIRVPPKYKRRALESQLREVENLASTISRDKDESNENVGSPKLTLTANTKAKDLEQRAAVVKERIGSLDGPGSASDWIVVNGFMVSETIVDDARAFHVPFKEPCLVTYRAIDAEVTEATETGESIEEVTPIPLQVMNTRSISTGRPPRYTVRRPQDLPGEGDLVAFDAEFVSVQEEESELTATGSKVTVREARSTLARVSAIDCRNGNVIIDDFVLPHEPVVDYLTRFSGIVARDLDPKNSPHHLVSMRSAYLKLRLLLQRGCIFVGHGLRQDFLMVNLFVPPRQIIDTVEIFHKERMRYVSLRFLANYLQTTNNSRFQEDTHDSVEDATMAYHVYLKALELKKEGTFDKVLNDLYEFGQKADWKLGVKDAE